MPSRVMTSADLEAAGWSDLFEHGLAEKGVANVNAIARRILSSPKISDISALITAVPTIADPLSDGANSTLQASQGPGAGLGMFNATNPLHATILGAPEFINGRNSLITRQTGSRIGGHVTGFAVETNAPAIDFSIKCNGLRWIAYITDLKTGERGRIAAADRAQAYSNYNYYKLTFADSRPRRVEVYAGNASSFAGINVATGYSVRPAAISQPRIAAFGDSFWGGTMNDTTLALRLAVADWFAAELGCANPTINGVGSTGVIATAGASNYLSYQGRLTAGDMDYTRIGHQDLVFVPGSINDGNPAYGGLSVPAGDATLQAAYQTFIADLMVRQPYAIIVGAPQEFTSSTAAAASRVAAYKAGFLAAAGGNPRMIWLDNTLFEAAPDTGVIGADLAHPGGAFGAQAIGQSLAASVRAKLQNLAYAA